MKKVIWIVILVLIVIGIMAFSGGDKTPVSTGPIKIGFMAPLSGDAATYGEPMRNIVAMAVEEINSTGGIKGRVLEVIYEDDKCSGRDGANVAQKLINVDHVQAIIGSACSGATLAAVPVAEAGKVALFSPAASSPDLTNRSRFFARDYPNDSSQGIILAEAAFTKKNWTKVAFIQEQLDYPLGIFKAFSARFQELGGEVIKEEFVSDNTDFRSQLAKLQAAKPDALFIDVQAGPAAGRILKQIKELKWTIPFLVNDVVSGDKEVIADNKAILEGSFAAEFGVSNNDKFQNLVTAYKTKYGSEMPYQAYGQTEYDSVFILKDAIEAVGYDGEKISNWLRTVKDWPGASGLVTIGADGDRVGGHILKVIENGEVVEVK